MDGENGFDLIMAIEKDRISGPRFVKCVCHFQNIKIFRVLKVRIVFYI